MQAYVDYLKSTDLEVKIKMVLGNVVNNIVEEANFENVSLIVTGRHKRHVIDELFIPDFDCQSRE